MHCLVYELYLIRVHKVHGFSRTLQAAEPKFLIH